ncbi:MAG: hypothetical protein PUP93_34580 [Rhizonema sp. NSF051]|nr:hypothetical protein [Rhizonema sp. NSF051]
MAPVSYLVKPARTAIRKTYAVLDVELVVCCAVVVVVVVVVAAVFEVVVVLCAVPACDRTLGIKPKQLS